MRRALTAIVVCLAASLLMAPAASAIDKVDTKKLRKGVTLKGMLEHLREFQEIAIANGDNRAATTPGYDASVAYVTQRLRAAGYRVTHDEFDFPMWEQNGPSTVTEDSPNQRTFAEGTDYIVSQFSSSGDVTAQVIPVDAAPVTEPGTSTSGCEPSDFPPSVQGNIALMMRGTCPFVQKYQNAKDAGAAAALIFNDGFPEREDPLFITSPPNIGIPTIMTSNDMGEYLIAEPDPTVMTIVVDATTTPNTEVNVIADSRRGDRDRTIVVGAHLDSVEAGPGINDNGSGTAGILEIAEQVAKLRDRPRNRLRFAFWGAEEAGLVGSTAYVQEQVDNGKIEDIEANLNFDMIASPNFVRFVYDGDLSDSAPPPSGAPEGSGQIEQMFLRHFRKEGLPTEPTAFDGRSDYGPFIAAGVPAGGLFTGAEGIKTEEQEAIYGGFAGMQYDPNYHEEGDTFFNLSYTALDQMADAAAHATWTLAESRSKPAEAKASKKGKRGKRGKRGKAWKYKGPFRVR